jgi:hypothetical protein
MLLAGEAGEQPERPRAASPAAGEAEQPPAQHGTGEVLLGDRRLAAHPAVTELAQIGEDGVAERGVERESRQQPVKGRLRAGLVEPIEGEAQLKRRLGRRRGRRR